MTRTIVSRTVQAPIESVFRTVAHIPKLTNPLIKGMIRKAIEKDMDAVKAFCEEGAA